MPQSFDDLLAQIRSSSRSSRDLGSAFEKLVSDFLVTDSTQKSRFCQVSSYADWARKQGLPADDAGIDLVATTKAGEYVAVQAKCYAAHRVIHKKDIDSFISASAKSHFAGRLIADTTEGSWSPQADEMLRDQNLKVTRLSLKEFRNSDVDWGSVGSGKPTNVKKFSPFKHQDEATEKVSTALATQDRGYMVMACGSGKTFTALQITEKMLSHKGLVLYVVPSLSLMNQSLQKWHQQAKHPIRSFAVCSDSRVGRREARKGDAPYTEPFDMVIPPTTDAGSLMKGYHSSSFHASDQSSQLTVIFSTYQSLATITEAQKLGLGEFDLVICDEAHRTTGVTHEGEDPSHFVKVHHNQYIKAKKRLYMTATPRIYSDSVKADASEEHVTLASMDDESVYGKLLYYYSFDQAVRDNRLTDYKVIILGVRPDEVSRLSLLFSEDSSEILLDDATKIIGAYKGLRGDWSNSEDLRSMKRVLAFAKDIKSSKFVKSHFSAVIEKYLNHQDPEDTHFEVAVDHVDGTYDTKKRSELISWLENVDDENQDSSVCHMLSNARCLSEGVDIPALDGVIFFHPRKSVVDVVQSVGRVMRKASGKDMGYVILPVCLPPETDSAQALDNHPNFKVIWQVLNALRSHDERLEAAINQISLGQDVSDRIAMHIPSLFSDSLRAVTDVVDSLPTASLSSSVLGGSDSSESRAALQGPTDQVEAPVWMDVIHQSITAQIVKRCGTREYWSDWSESAAKIAHAHITRIKGLIHKEDHPENRKIFDRFLVEIRDDLNDSITENDAIEMLSQHLITRPIFESLFAGRAFVDKNPVSQAMSKVMDLLDQNNVHHEAKELEGFYHRLKIRSQGLTDPKAKQQLITELYEKFFAKAFPRTVEMLGIAYTPVEIVDFMIRSVQEILKEEFGLTLGSEGVHILDPFVGTGTFITRLFQSGLISPEELQRKYLGGKGGKGGKEGPEIHANEILLLAYYIAAINIETAYEGVMGGDHQSKSYEPFRGICLTDTFGLHEKDDQTAELFEVNSQRITYQKSQKVRVILGNPPYSVGQKSANDNAANTSYERLDSRIASTYVNSSIWATSNKALYNSYIRAFRLASDLIEEASGGVLAFITDAGWVESVAGSGLRYHLVRDFSKIYVFHLRGRARGSAEFQRKEGTGVFGQSSRCPVAINFFIRHQNHASQAGPAEIHYYDIGDYLKREAKLTKIERLGSIAGITALKDQGWQKLSPDGYHDWLNQRDPGFGKLLALGDKRGREDKKIFENYSLGIATARDVWCYNPCRLSLLTNMERMIGFYNQEVEHLHAKLENPSITQTKKYVDRDPTKIKWADTLFSQASRRQSGLFSADKAVLSSYRPFVKQWLYMDRLLNARVYQIPKIFPLDPSSPGGTRENVVIGVGKTADWSVLVTDCIPDLNMLPYCQFFPRYLYDPETLERKEAITEQALAHFQASYLGGDSITKEQIFFYIYGILQSKDYQSRFDANLKKELARIPVVTSLVDFKAFSAGGRALADLHLDYEKDAAFLRTYACHELGVRVVEKEKFGDKKASDPVSYYRVKKMKWSDRDKELSQITYNPFITIENIPSEVMAFEVSGRPALQWVVDYQKVKVDKASGITKDPNAYGDEQGHPEYLLDLVLAVIAVSVKTQRLIETLPKLTIKSHTDAVRLSRDLSRVS